jgi:DNA-binding HxlR family transcriptional regulator
VRYHLTDLGRSLLEPLEAVRAWGRRHLAEVERARLDHDAR